MVDILIINKNEQFYRLLLYLQGLSKCLSQYQLQSVMSFPESNY